MRKTPGVPSADRVKLRLRLISEEFVELLESAGVEGEALHEIRLKIEMGILTAGRVNLSELYDATLDLDYVVEGTRLEFGLNGEPGAAEVHRANMAKLHDGVPVHREDGKIIKPPGWTPPDIEGVLRSQGWKG